MKKILMSLLVIMLLTGCQSNKIEETKEENSYKKISVNKAYREIYLEDGIFTLIDVRTKEEYEAGHLRKAINIPLDELTENNLPIEKDFSIILYCRSGVRAEKAAKTLVELGYTNVSTFGGIIDWTYEDEIVK